MARFTVALVLILAAAPQSQAHAQRIHEIRLVQSAAGDAYRFQPDEVTARARETLEFRVESGGPYQVAFEPADLTPPARQLLELALGTQSGTLRGPLLARPGDRFRITLPSLPPGRYRFFCLLHVAYRMSGALVVK